MSINKAFQRAQAVLAVFETMYDCVIVEAVVETYKDGRENGFAITIFEFINDEGEAKETNPETRQKAFFTECRNSEDIVVCFCSCYRDEPDEHGYKNRKYFNPDSYAQTAKYIWRKLTQKKALKK